MNRPQLKARAAALWRWLTLDGRLAFAQPVAPAAGALALALGALFPSRWLLYLAYAYLLLALAAYLWVRTVGPRLTLRRHLDAQWAQVGDDLEESWELENAAPLPLLWAEIDDESTLPGYSARRVVAAEAGERVAWRTAARCERRGVYRLGPLAVRTGDPLGLFRLTWRQGSPRELTIYPPLVRLPPLPLPRGARGGPARADLLQIHVTPNVAGVRQYAPGDPPSRVHWPYLARHGELYVKEFDQERAGALWIVLDLWAGAYPAAGPAAAAAQPEAPAYAQSSVAEAAPDEVRPPTVAELAVTVAASLAAQALAEGRSVGLLCDDGTRRVVAPAGGQRQLWRLLNALVDGAPAGPRPLGALLRGGLGGMEGTLQGGALVVVTGDLGGAWLPALLERLGGRPEAAVALLAAPRPEDAAPCAALLAASGVQARAFALGAALPLASPPRRRVKSRVSPFGRVVKA
jgi:uncharacterized protein (DUF58 family)